MSAWTEAQAQESPQKPEPPPPVPAEELSAPGEPQEPAVGLFDPLPPRRPTNGASSPPNQCEICSAGIEQPQRGARRRYCGPACRQTAAAERATRREAADELAPLPDEVERPFAAFVHAYDVRSDPAALAAARLPWENEARASLALARPGERIEPVEQVAALGQIGAGLVAPPFGPTGLAAA